MIATIEAQDQMHIVKWTGRVRLHVGVTAYCGLRADGADGVLQVPDTVFTQGLVYQMEDGRKVKACSRCRLAVQATVG